MISIRYKYFLYLFLVINTCLNSQTLESIKISDNKNFSENDYIQWIDINAGTKYFPGILDSAKVRVAKNLANRGYFHSNFDGSEYIVSPDSQKFTLNFNINEGDPTYIKNINFTGADSLDSINILSDYDYLKGEIFNPEELRNEIIKSLTYYEDNGLPFTKIIISSVYFYNDSSKGNYYADVNLKLEKGQRSTIDRIEISGNTKTKDYVINRELRLEPDQEYNQKLVDELPSRLNRLGYFEPVSTPQFFIDKNGKGVLLITVKEKNTNNFDGIVGYVPPQTSSGSEKINGYFTGLVDISMRNLFGTGRAAAIHWQQYNSLSQDLQLKYLEPWILGYPFNINLGLYQKKQDSSYIQRKLNASLEFLATEEISASFTISSESIIPTTTSNNIFTVFNSSSLTTGIGIKVDSRDDPYSPTRGLLFETDYSFSNKRIYGPARFITPGLQTRIKLQRIQVGLNLYYEPFTRQVIALGLHGDELRGPFLEQSDLYRLGGTNSLRGYREEQFLGSRIAWSNLEYRFLLTRRTFAFLLFDTGYYLRPADQFLNIQKSEGFKIGYGLGLNVETSLGILSVSYALAKGNSFSDGLIHFGIVSEF